MIKDLTEGPLLSTLITFTIPLVIGNLLQLTYNAIDSMIVGKFVGSQALAAVGTGNPIMTLVLLFINGICLGAGILVSYHYGAGHIDILQRQTSTGMIAGFFFSLGLGLLITFFARPIFVLLQVDASIMDISIRYLRIIMLSLVFSFIYNYLASVLRAMGDSKSPLYFLTITSILNILGDLCFVLVFHMGVVGVALSTACCEALSALLCWAYTSRHISVLRLKKNWFTFDFGLFHQIFAYGTVSALQQSGIQMGKLATQAMVNTLGVSVTAAFNATNRFDDFAIIPEQNIGHGMSSIIAQNIGHQNLERVKKTFRYGVFLEIGFGIGIGLLLYTFANPIMHLFTDDTAVIVQGENYLHIIACMYILPSLTNAMQGYFRGTGDLKITLWSTLINMSVRTLCCFLLMKGFHWGFEAVPWSYLMGWIAMIAFELPCMLHHKTFIASSF